MKVAGAATTVTGMAGCLGDDSDAIEVGALLPLSGGFAPWAGQFEKGLELGLKEINENGGVLDREIDLTVRDSGGEVREAANLLSQFVDEGVAAAIGPISSDVAIRTAQIAEESEVPLFLVEGGTHEAITMDSQYTFRSGQTGPLKLKAEAELVEEVVVDEMGVDEMGAIIADYSWGHNTRRLIEEFYPDEVEVHFEVAPVTEDDFSTYIRNLPETEVYTFQGHPPGHFNIVGQMNELGRNPELILATVMPAELMVSALGEQVLTNTYLLPVDAHTPEFEEFGTSWAEEYEEPVYTQGAKGYVNAMVLQAAIEEAGSDDPSEIAAALREVEVDTLYAEPVQFSEWGQLNMQREVWNGFEFEPPSYFPEGDFRLNEFFTTSVLESPTPAEWREILDE